MVLLPYVFPIVAIIYVVSDVILTKIKQIKKAKVYEKADIKLRFSQTLYKLDLVDEGFVSVCMISKLWLELE